MARQGTPIEPGLIARAVGAIRDWFGPGQPVVSVAPREEVAGRAYDFPVAINLAYRPRSESGENGIDFATLRALADPTQGGLGLLRLAIETRKDQMESQRWGIKARNEEGDGGDKARAIELALRKPDRLHSWSQWQRMLLEDLLVIDAPCIYLAPSTLGYRVPEVIDGATIKLLVRQDGRTPLPPEPAFQQVLKGVPATDYTLDELVYAPRNLRSHKLYGMSPVEQVVMTVNIALRREVSQLEQYTAGSIPDAVMALPENWSPSQVAEFQTYWDTLLTGNTAEQRRARFVPGGTQPFILKPNALKDEFDEWLARIIAYAFSLSPQALVKEMNRATAQTAKEAAQEEGLEPLKRWWKDVIDEVLAKAFDAPDLELAWQDEEIADPETKAKVWVALAGNKPIVTQDEARNLGYGLPPLTPEQRDELAPAPLMLPAPGDGEQPDPEADAAKVAKARARRRALRAPSA